MDLWQPDLMTLFKWSILSKSELSVSEMDEEWHGETLWMGSLGGSVGEDRGEEENQGGLEVRKELEFHHQTTAEQQAVRKQHWQCQTADKNIGAFQFHWKGEVLW